MRTGQRMRILPARGNQCEDGGCERIADNFTRVRAGVVFVRHAIAVSCAKWQTEAALAKLPWNWGLVQLVRDNGVHAFKPKRRS